MVYPSGATIGDVEEHYPGAKVEALLLLPASEDRHELRHLLI